jgi:hypothetical protein
MSLCGYTSGMTGYPSAEIDGASIKQAKIAVINFIAVISLLPNQKKL